MIVYHDGTDFLSNLTSLVRGLNPCRLSREQENALNLDEDVTYRFRGVIVPQPADLKPTSLPTFRKNDLVASWEGDKIKVYNWGETFSEFAYTGPY